jgi:hypothetical protein
LPHGEKQPTSSGSKRQSSRTSRRAPQAEDRAHRIGQALPVHVYAYLASATIEERIEEILAEKRTLFRDLVDGVDTAALKRLDLDTLLAAVRDRAA